MADLFTVKQLSEKLGVSFLDVERSLQENSCQPTERKGLLRYYSQDVVDLLEEKVQK